MSVCLSVWHAYVFGRIIFKIGVTRSLGLRTDVFAPKIKACCRCGRCIASDASTSSLTSMQAEDGVHK